MDGMVWMKVTGTEVGGALECQVVNHRSMQPRLKGESNFVSRLTDKRMDRQANFQTGDRA
jgi:hypothetical protein